MIPAAPIPAAVRNERRDTPDSFTIDVPIISLLAHAAYVACLKLCLIGHDACRTKRMSTEKKGLGAVESNEKGSAEADPCGSYGAVLNVFALLGDFLLFVAENHAGALNSEYHREHGEQHREHKLQAVG